MYKDSKFFVEIMSVLVNFIRIDNTGFLSNARHIEIVIAMAKSVSVMSYMYM